METHIEKRFYVPEPEEFCLGFEYDHANYGGKLVVGAQIEKEWITTIVEDSYDFNSVRDVYNEGKQCTDIRVKILDEQDIIDCGFVKTKEYSDELLFQKQISDYEFFEITFYLDVDEDINISVDRFRQSKMVVKRFPVEERTWDVLTVFHGTIKNKTEFKKLLKQIGVYEN